MLKNYEYISFPDEHPSNYETKDVIRADSLIRAETFPKFLIIDLHYYHRYYLLRAKKKKKRVDEEEKFVLTTQLLIKISRLKQA